MSSSTSSKKKKLFFFIHRTFYLFQHLDTFVNKRKERFGQIADEHQFLLRHKFRELMENIDLMIVILKLIIKKKNLK